MKRILIPIPLLVILIYISPFFVAAERGIKINKERRLALVIGNGDYGIAPLRNPVNDANDMAEALRKMGFEVIHKNNATFKTMDEAVMDFGRRLRQGGVGLFYFAGHGIQVKGRNYLIPVDAKIETESDVRYKALDVGRILGKMEDAENALNVIILDACRNNPFARSFRSSNPGLARMDAPKGSLVAYATAPGSVAADGMGRNGIYTKHLLKHMETSGLKVEEVLKRVRIDVMEETADRQTPWESSSLRGDFYFMSDKAPEQDEQMTATSQTAALGERKKKLERERQELEQLKLEIERKKIELERQRLEEEKRRLAELKKTAESSRQEKAEKPIGEARPKVEGHDMRVSVSPNNQKKPVPPQTASVGIREKMPVEPPKDQYRLAVFPWYTEKITGYYTNMFLESNLNAIARVFHEKEAVFITQSYYLHDKFSRTVKIIKEVLNKKGVKGLWMKKSMFSELEPDINRVIGYGRDLKVDLVLMINTDYYSWNAGGPIKIYLIDISNEKPYSGEFHNPRWPRLVSEEVIEAAMKRVMNQFLSGRLKSQ